jgi:hypothetical protein
MESYVEGSSVNGFWFEDYVSLGDMREHNPPVRVQLGCNSNEESLFFTQRANGIMGLAPFQEGRPTILTDLFHDANKAVNSMIFSICLAEWGGQLNVGGYNVSYHTAPSQWIPLKKGRYYAVQLDALHVGDQLVVHGSEYFKDAILDTGTTYTRLPEAVFSAFDSQLRKYCQVNEGCGATRVGVGCWRAGSLQGFPLVQMRFGQLLVDWQAEAYLVQQGNGLWCRGYRKGGPSSQTILGANWMMWKELIFDLESWRLGVAPALCPSHRKEDRPAIEFLEGYEDFAEKRPLAERPSARAPVECFAGAIAVALLLLFAVARHVRTTHTSHNSALLRDEVLRSMQMEEVRLLAVTSNDLAAE